MENKVGGQRERTEVEKILATLVVETENWVGFFPEDKIQGAKSALLKVIEERIRAIKGEWSKNPQKEMSWMIKRTEVISVIQELFNAK